MAHKKVQTVRIEGQIFWLARRDPKSGRWLGVCPPLNLNAIGDTYDELQACANEAMALLFLDLVQEGDLTTFMRKNGWKMAGELEPGVEPRFDIPADWKHNARFEDLVAAHA